MQDYYVIVLHSLVPACNYFCTAFADVDLLQCHHSEAVLQQEYTYDCVEAQ